MLKVPFIRFITNTRYGRASEVVNCSYLTAIPRSVEAEFDVVSAVTLTAPLVAALGARAPQMPLYIKLSDIEDRTDTIKTQLRTFQTQLDNETYLLYETQINYLTNKLDKVTDQLKSLKPSRAKRGLVNGFGSIIKSITGNLDYSDALKYDHAIKTLQDSQTIVVIDFNNHISISKEWMSRHNLILIELANNQRKINDTLQIILDQNAYRDSSLIKYAKFAQLLEIIGENIDDLLTELLRIENTLAFIRASSAHHSMLDIIILRSMIDKLRKIYNKEQILGLELREYYDVIKTASYYTEDRIVIVFRFPIVSLDIYNLYRLSIVPNKHNQALIPFHPYIATGEKKSCVHRGRTPEVKHLVSVRKERGNSNTSGGRLHHKTCR
ncbi:PREDICTED: uncharacterized protein LOC106100847 [Papilio polytes]|uniref:uncharacterized protein LOC106100847 n=1 Tax=Papilio polytes TaxID=76194 RepID=UPI000675D580|nr:PREDICTED: uncharacterized protein LOC106100847 [Papilio polytes]